MTHTINFITIAVMWTGLFLFFLTDSRRVATYAFLAITLVVFSINIQFWSWSFALVKFVTFSTALLILNLSPEESNESIFGGSRSGMIFRAAVLVFGLIFVGFIAPKTQEFLGMDLDQVYASFFLILCGLMQLGISKNPYRAILGLLTFFMGFEIIYGSVEKSLLINGMLAALVLLIALIGSYLQINSKVSENQ